MADVPDSGSGETVDLGSIGQEVPPEQPDPLQDLIERVKVDGRAVFETPVLEALCQLEDSDPGRYTQLHWDLQRAGVMMDLLRKAMQKVRAAARKQEKAAAAAAALTQVQPTDVQILIALGSTNVHLFHTPSDVPFADYKVGGHIATGPIVYHGPKSFGGWLAGEFHRTTGGAASSESLSTALNTLQVKAVYDGPEIAVFPRVGWADGKVYVDRGTPDWSVIEIDQDGWRAIDQAPIRFIRGEGTEPLPMPVPGGNIGEFRELFFNLAGEDDFVLTVCWDLASFNPDGGYPILVICGPHDSSKTTTMGSTRRLSDPNKADTRTLPSSERDLLVVAQLSWIQSFDNTSKLSLEMSDAFCRLSTGAAYAARKLFTDTGEIILTARRPAMFTSVPEIIEQPDLADRCFFVNTNSIPDSRRLTKKAFDKKFNEAWPRLLGVMLDAVSMALRNYDDEPPEALPRMADAAAWILAGEEAFGWPRGTFLAAYRRNVLASARMVIESDLLGSAILTFMSMPDPADFTKRRESWSGTATGLLHHLRVAAGEGAARSRDWPKTPSVLGRVLRRLVPALAKVDIKIESSSRHGLQRLLTIYWADSARDDHDTEQGFGESEQVVAPAEPSPSHREKLEKSMEGRPVRIRI
jgi:hypothetical protein